jgi:hypothetical protein
MFQCVAFSSFPLVTVVTFHRLSMMNFDGCEGFSRQLQQCHECFAAGDTQNISRIRYQNGHMSFWQHWLTALISIDSSCRLVRAASGDQAFNCWISSCRQLSKEPQTAGQIYRKSKMYNDNNVVYLCISPNLV